MSSYGNHCWTPERDLIARRLVLAAMNTDDDEFEEIIDQAETCGHTVAVAALLAETLAARMLDGIEYEDHDTYVAAVAEAARPLVAQIAELERELGAQAIRWRGCKCDRCDRPLRDFIQVDGWANVKPGDYVMVPDSDGDVVMNGRTREPQRSGTTVRILIAADADRTDVLRVIRKQLAWMEDGLIDGKDLADDIDAELFSEWMSRD